MPDSNPSRVALVTGGAVRIGRHIARALADDGFRVAINYLDSEQQALELRRDIERVGGVAGTYRADLTEADGCQQLIRAVEADLGPIDLLVNNAAVFERQPWLQQDDALWRRHLALNLEAPHRLARLVAPGMWQRGHGRIVNICGTIGIHPAGDYVPYRVAKSGLDELTRSLAEALAPRVQVNGVAPGAIVFPEGTTPQQRQEVLARVPAGTEGSPSDVAAAVLFFAHAPDYVTGAILPVDGGAAVTAG